MKDIKDITSLLVNVDMVNGFVKKGAMADPYIQNIVPEHIRLMKKMQEKQEGIAIIKDTHKEKCREFNRFPAHCVEGTQESELIEELKVFEKDALLYQKNSTCTMYAPNFIEDIEKMKNLKEIIIIGCCTDICILNLAIPLQNYFDQKDVDIKITIPKNAVETYHGLNHNREEYNTIAFKLMQQAGINIVETLSI